MDTPIEIATAVRAGERKAVEVLDGCLAAIDDRNPALNAFTVVDADGARRAAEAVDAAVARGEDPGAFAGVPFAVKDLYDCTGLPTGKGSRLFLGAPPAVADAVDVARLRAAGAVPVGKTTLPEFGTLAFTSTQGWGTTRNPWDPATTPGGSSGGSAAAVAGGMLPMATSGDGGGSTRIPAAFSGLVGHKASYGRIPFPDNCASQTDTKGILVTTVADAARHLDVTCGPDDRDRTSLPEPADVRRAGGYEGLIETLDVSGLRVAWSVDLGYAVVDPEVAAITESAARELVRVAGMTDVTVAIDLPDPVRVWLSQGVLDLFMDLEPGMWPDRADELEGFTRFALQASEQAAPAQIARVWQRRMALERAVAAVYDQVDILLTPTTAVPAFAAEGPMPTEIAGQTVFPAMATPFTMIANLCWNPAVSVPAGLTAAGLPVGLQIQGRRHADEVVLRLARLLEQARPWPRLAPA
ncbi:MAG TPA: amidase family protein [Acidimicrobiales bacterium]